jgi:dCMP deaminase
MRYNTINNYLNLANSYAKLFSGCNKVQVGAVIVKNGKVLALGANRAIPDQCIVRGCQRVELYGEDSKNHRLPSDCRAIHSEVDAICNAASQGISLEGATIYVTRYPCEACARAIVASGIKYVVYGREQSISEQTMRIFGAYDIEHTWVKSWVEEDTTR